MTDKKIHYVSLTSGGWGEPLLGLQTDCPIQDTLNTDEDDIPNKENILFSNDWKQITCKECKEDV